MNFAEKISQIKEKNLYRKLQNCDFLNSTEIKKDEQKLICFSSNDYLSLANSDEVKQASINAIKQFGASSRGSRYVCGNNSLYQKLEKKLAQTHKMQDALVFSSGYQTAIGVIPALVCENDLVIADKLIHACLIDGVKLSGAKMTRFKHNNYAHLREILQKNREKFSRILIISEEIFSMDGDKADLVLLNKIALEFSCILLIDCAHSLYDKKSTEPLESSQSAPIIKMGTLSKALGNFGGYVVSDELIVDYLRNFSRSAVYTTALPPAVLAGSLAALEIATQDDSRATKALKNAQYFCDLMEIQRTQSAIVIIEIGDSAKALEIANRVQENGFLISAIRPPTVASARLRITFCVAHEKKEVEKLAEILKKLTQ